MNAQVIALVNQKGGVGKSTSCVNLGVGLAQAGKKVLLVDCDPQSSLSISLGHPQPDKLPITLSDMMGKVLTDQPIAPGEGILHHAEGVDLMPSEHKARWFAGAALNTSEQAMASVLSTVLSRLNAFLDTELEQTICFDSPLDAETFASRKSAIFLILPEEDQTKNFMAGLMIQNLARELFSVADENGGKLKNRVVLFCDELGTMPPFDILPLFSAGRSRRLTLVPIIQSLAQLEKNYGREGSEIIPIAIYKQALLMLDRAVKSSSLYAHLRERGLDYSGAWDTLNAEIPQLMKGAMSFYPEIRAAYQLLPMFREWLVEDVLERNYQDVPDGLEAPVRHANDQDAPEWLKEALSIPAVEHSEPERDGANTPVPPAPEAVPNPAGAGAPEQPEKDAAIPVEPDFAPNADQYWDLKAQHPDKLVGVQVGEFMMFYGKDAEEASAALGTKAPVLDIPGLGQTPATGSRDAWQAVLKKLLEHEHSVVLARPDPEHGPDAPYEVIRESSAADYIPVGMELMMDGRRMKIDSVDYANNEVKLLDLDIRGWFPVFRSAPVPYVRESVEDALTSEEYITAEMAHQLRQEEAAEAAAASTQAHDGPAQLPEPEPEQVEIDGGQIAQPKPPAPWSTQERHNFHITDDNLGAGGEKTKYQYNVTAIRTLKQIEGEGRLATPEEQEVLSRYVGWGGISKAFDPDDPKWAKEYAELKELLTPEEYNSARSTVLNAHYTSPTVIKAMYQAVENMKFQPGTVLDESVA